MIRASLQFLKFHPGSDGVEQDKHVCMHYMVK